jgi:hypothetical protein
MDNGIEASVNGRTGDPAVPVEAAMHRWTTRSILVSLASVLYAFEGTAAVVPVARETVLASLNALVMPKGAIWTGSRFAVVHEAEAGPGSPSPVVLRFFDRLSGVPSDAVEVTPLGAYPQVAAFVDGSLVVSWNVGTQWFVRFFDTTGSATTEAIPIVSEVSTYLRLATGSEGRWVAVYERYVAGEVRWEVVGRRFDGSSALDAEPFLIGPAEWSTWMTPVAMNLDDEFLVAWERPIEDDECCEDPSSTYLWGRAYDSEGDPRSEPAHLSTDFHYDEQGEAGHWLVRGEGSGFAAAWLDVFEGLDDEPGYLVYRTFGSTGTPNADSRILAEIDSRSRGVSLARTSDQVVVALTSGDSLGNYDIDFYSTPAAGGAVERLGDDTMHPKADFEPVVAADSSGALLLVWERLAIESPSEKELVARPYFVAGEILCGDASYDGELGAPDALGSLRAAVGAIYCAAAVCDSSGDGAVTASDASRILRKSVGIDVAMSCPASGEAVPAP